MILSSSQMEGGDQDVDDLDADERSDDAAEAIDQQLRRKRAAAPTGR